MQSKLLIVSPRAAVIGFALLYGLILAGCLSLLLAGGLITIVAIPFVLLAAVGLLCALSRPELWKGGAPQHLGVIVGWKSDGTRVMQVIKNYSAGLIGPLLGMVILAILGCCCGCPIAVVVALL